MPRLAGVRFMWNDVWLDKNLRTYWQVQESQEDARKTVGGLKASLGEVP